MANLITLEELYSTKDLELRIKEIGKQQGVTMTKLAERMGYSKTYLSRVMNGHITLSIKHLEEISKALDIHVHELIRLPEGYEHIYGKDSGTWLGIRIIDEI